MRAGRLTATTEPGKRVVKLTGAADAPTRIAGSVKATLTLSRFVGSDRVWVSVQNGLHTFAADDVQRALSAVMQDGPR